MKITIRPLLNVDQTLAAMRDISRTYAGDMARFATWNLSQIHELVKNIPYHRDPPGLETVQRPYYTLTQAGTGGDCDDKAVMIAAWAILNKFPVKFVASGRYLQKPLHHVYPLVYIMGRWIISDATYSFNVLGRPLFREAKRIEYNV